MSLGNRIFGYYLASNSMQSDKKMESLLEYAFERDIYSDNILDSERPSLKCLLSLLKPGDTIYLDSLDNIMSSKEGLKDLLGLLRKNRIKICVVDLPSTLINAVDFFDCDKSVSDLAIDIIIDIVAKEAGKEKSIARRRQEIGFDEARKNGVKLGRKPKKLPETFEQDYREWKAGNCTAASLYKRYGISNPCFYRKVKEYESKFLN